MGLRPLLLFQFLLCGHQLYTLEFDVFRRQIVTYIDGTRTESVNKLSIQMAYHSFNMMCVINTLKINMQNKPSINDLLYF